jgi:hypothetical protein
MDPTMRFPELPEIPVSSNAKWENGRNSPRWGKGKEPLRALSFSWFECGEPEFLAAGGSGQ